MFSSRICHITTIIREGIKTLTDTQRLLFGIFIACNAYDLIVTTVARVNLPGFVEYNPFLNTFVQDPATFFVAMLLSKILAVCVIAALVIWVNNMKIEIDGNRIYGTPVVLVVTMIAIVLCAMLTYNMVVAIV